MKVWCRPKSQLCLAGQSCIANALDAKVIFVSAADLDDPEHLADKLDVFAKDYGGLASLLGSILMRVKNVPNI